MPTTPALADTAARTVDEQFLALMCSDEDLLRAEFDAIITAEWPSPPTTTPRRGAAHRHPASYAHRRGDAPVAGAVPRPRPPASADGSGNAPPRRGSHKPTTGKAGDRPT
jgi:hypothetical protein